MSNGIISIIGRSNTGKSSLFNLLSIKKYSIVTEKKNTTIRCLDGYIDYERKIKIIDTPGPMLNQRNNIYNANKLIYDSIKISDSLIVVVDGTNLKTDDFFILELIKNYNLYKMLVINKYDKINNQLLLLNFMKKINDYMFFNNVLYTSTITKLNIIAIKNCILNFYKNSAINNDNFLNDSYSNLIKDSIRKALLDTFDREIPYITKINIKKKNLKKTMTFLSIELLVRKNVQKKIIIGKNGKKIAHLIQRIIDYVKYNQFKRINNVKIEIIYDNSLRYRHN